MHYKAHHPMYHRDIPSDHSGNDNEYSIEAFRQKLDELTESLDDKLNFDQIIQNAKNTTPITQILSLQQQQQQHHAHESNANSATSIVMTDDLNRVETTPTLRRFPMTTAEFSGNTTTGSNTVIGTDTGTGTSSSRNTRILSSATRNNTNHTHNSLLLSSASSPEPPTPVKTPLRSSSSHQNIRSTVSGIGHTMSTPTIVERRYNARASATSNATKLQRNAASSSTSQRSHTTATGGTTSSSSARTTSLPSSASHHPNQQPNESNTIIDHETLQPQEDIQIQLNEMYRIIQQHEDRIRQLEYENDVLLLQRQNMTCRSGLDKPLRSKNSNHDHHHHSYAKHNTNLSYSRRQDNTNHPPHPSSTSSSSSSSSSAASVLGGDRSPGKQFVAEFVQIMDLPSNLHEPLSNIMDRQFFARTNSR